MDPTMLVTGGTGMLGRRLVPRLRATGHEIRVLSRKPHADQEGVEFVVGDLVKDHGVERAVEGVTTIVHCAGRSRGDAGATRTLVEAARRVGAPHLVYISVVGADRLPMHGLADRTAFGYFDNKHLTEYVVSGSGLPWTTLRATQFHDLVLVVCQGLARLPVVPVARDVRFQPVDTDEVAARLVELAIGQPQGRVPDLAGPAILPMRSIVESYLRVTRRAKRVLSVPVPGDAARAVRAGANLAPEHAVGKKTWEDFLAERFLVP